MADNISQKNTLFIDEKELRLVNIINNYVTIYLIINIIKVHIVLHPFILIIVYYVLNDGNKLNNDFKVNKINIVTVQIIIATLLT